MHELLIILDKGLQTSLNRQIYEQIRKAIFQGVLHHGDVIPSTRLLAEQLQVSRSVVIQAYEQLQSEGYLIMKKGAGTYIAENAANENNSRQEATQKVNNYDIFTNASHIVSVVNSPPIVSDEQQNSVVFDFRYGVPSWEAFPMDRWQKVLAEACRKATPDILGGYGPAEGSYRLRKEIARLLRSTRAIPAVPDQIIITAGATQALDMISRLFLKDGDRVIVEDPAHPVLRETFCFAGGNVVSVPVDEEGLRVQDIEPIINEQHGNNGDIKLIYVTPSHQFPAGMTMSQQRRIELLDYANKNNTYIIEDDYDSEYRYVGQKVSALAGLDSSGRVIYVGSFSKSLFPGLRIGYAVMPASLIKSFLAIKCITSRMTPTLEQEALAEFIASGQYARHVNGMGKLYGARRSCLVQSLHRHFQDRVTAYGDEAGLHLLIQLKTEVTEELIADKALQCGVKVYPASEYFVISKPKTASFLLGYANMTEFQIERGVELLAQVEGQCTRNKEQEAVPKVI
ncbi:GntR family transcriptional regulator/MocR family aminotransferase [Fontibacillus solani]|uniref:GntR family transcriptional regulator/MocR family aminotransferase n=1 Tax=Fontibacillus solani TaxID=1572857 RepID=A0A7W3SRR5_9BACL|nr:PLP-dependent aminotransferase family protein [Fontibacillus solani]MBA9085062.1 GntR family transcriptional regulator/MocR family aminotransferase [Fontibacillus solani]